MQNRRLRREQMQREEEEERKRIIKIQEQREQLLLQQQREQELLEKQKEILKLEELKQKIFLEEQERLMHEENQRKMLLQEEENLILDNLGNNQESISSQQEEKITVHNVESIAFTNENTNIIVREQVSDATESKSRGNTVVEYHTPGEVTRAIGAHTDKDALLLEGYLYKQDSSGVTKSWRRRWFSVQEDQLVYWKEMHR